jgi:hypothetical protein
MWPCQRLIVKRWCTLVDLERLSRRDVLEQNRWLDALEDADAESQRKAAEKAKADAARR